MAGKSRPSPPWYELFSAISKSVHHFTDRAADAAHTDGATSTPAGLENFDIAAESPAAAIDAAFDVVIGLIFQRDQFGHFRFGAGHLDSERGDPAALEIAVCIQQQCVFGQNLGALRVGVLQKAKVGTAFLVFVGLQPVIQACLRIGNANRASVFDLEISDVSFTTRVGFVECFPAVPFTTVIGPSAGVAVPSGPVVDSIGRMLRRTTGSPFRTPLSKCSVMVALPQW